jgi:rhodanese-related sulfurtransferase/predicted transcriptional regulator
MHVTAERHLKDMLYQEFARIGKSLSSPKRLEILDLLSQGPKSVESLSAYSGMSVANVSSHLQTLRNAKLVHYTKQGNFVIYKLANDAVASFINVFHALSEQQLLQVQQIKQEFMNNHHELEGLSLAVLQDRREKGEVLLLDVRPREEYEEAHIPGAVSVPLDELREKLQDLPADLDIVAYCRGSYCLMSVKAVEQLKEQGFRALRLEKGVQDWHAFAQGQEKSGQEER